MIASANSDRDLEISTSLDVQALDTRVDSFAAKQVSSQQITAGHLEKIQEKVQAVRILHHTTHETTLEISKSTEKIHQTLHDIRTSQAESQQSTRLQAEKLDGALAAIQRSLLSMASNGRPRPKTLRAPRKSHQGVRSRRAECSKEYSMPDLFSDLVQHTVDVSTSLTQINKLVDLAVTVRYRCGKATYESIAVPDVDFEAADFETKLRMVKYLQDLRLLLWLLCQKEFTTGQRIVFQGLPQSLMMSEANLVFLWTSSMNAELAVSGRLRSVCSVSECFSHSAVLAFGLFSSALASKVIKDTFVLSAFKKITIVCYFLASLKQGSAGDWRCLSCSIQHLPQTPRSFSRFVHHIESITPDLLDFVTSAIQFERRRFSSVFVYSRAKNPPT